jgi:hypothetical protein
MGNKFVELLERPFIEQQVDALARAQLAFFVLPLLSRRAPARVVTAFGFVLAIGGTLAIRGTRFECG